MIPPALAEVLILLAAALAVVVAFQRLRLPSSLGYLLVGALVGPHALGLVPDVEHNRVLAEFGIVFLLFTIGLNFTLPQIMALRHQVFVPGTAQVALTTLAAGALGWHFLGLPVAAAFVLGAVFAQSSTTIISRQLAEAGEADARHGRTATAMSIFQDVTAVPLLVVLPVMGAAGTQSLAAPLAAALVKAAAAVAMVYFAGRWLLRPLFREVAARRSPELFALAVLLVTLAAASATASLGLSMALGAFVAGMVLGETEFRHVIESTIRPIRDVLLGLFFVTVGMLFDPRALPAIWHYALAGAAVLLALKAAIVFGIVRAAGSDARTALRTAIVLAIGGEFGFALLAIALPTGAVSPEIAQVILNAVLFSMVAGAFLIRHNRAVADRLAPRRAPGAGAPAAAGPPPAMRDHVIVCGYGRVGQNLGRFLEEEGVPYVAVDLDAERVREAHEAGLPVFFGDAGERDLLAALGLVDARLVVVCHDDLGSARRTLSEARALDAGVPIMVRSRDERPVEELLAAGATEVVPETLEASMMIASHALVLAGIDPVRVERRLRDAQTDRYRLMRELYAGEAFGRPEGEDVPRLESIAIEAGTPAVGRALSELPLDDCRINALARHGRRHLRPDPDTRLEAGDVLVLFGTPAALERSKARLIEPDRP